MCKVIKKGVKRKRWGDRYVRGVGDGGEWMKGKAKG